MGTDGEDAEGARYWAVISFAKTLWARILLTSAVFPQLTSPTALVEWAKDSGTHEEDVKVKALIACDMVDLVGNVGNSAHTQLLTY